MTATDTDTRRAWLEERRQGIGASDVAAIGSVPGAYGSPWSVWADKCGLTPLDDDALEDDDPRTFGRDLEGLIAERFERMTGLYVVNRQAMVRYQVFPRWFATIDGEVADTPTDPAAPTYPAPLGVFESKYAAGAPWDDVPEHYVWQLQWQMMCTGHTHAWLAALHLPFGRPRFRIYEVDRDDKLIDRIQTTVAHFWNEHVVTGDPPPADDHPATADTIDALYGHLQTRKVPRLALDDYAELVDDIARCRKQKADAVRRLEQLEPRLKAIFGAENPELSDGTIGGDLAVSWRSQTRTDIDRGAVRRDHGDRYDYTQTLRVLRLHGSRLA